MKNRNRERAFELDALRGLAIFMMVLHHLIFDLRYMLDLDVFAFQESAWFQHLLRPFFVAVFLIVSGICCSFSRSNFRRGLRMLAAAGVLTVASYFLDAWTGETVVIYFNVIHIIAAGTLLFALLEVRDRRAEARGGRECRSGGRELRSGLSILIGAALLFLYGVLPVFQTDGGVWRLPLGLMTDNGLPAMADYLPLIPWLGFFFIGAAIGRIYYRCRASLFAGAPDRLVHTLRPLTFLGRHALVVYLLHQPIVLGLLLLLREVHIL